MVQAYLPTGTDAPVNTETAGTQGNPHVVSLPSGGYTIVWGGSFEVRARTYTSTGDPVGDEVQIDNDLGYD